MQDSPELAPAPGSLLARHALPVVLVCAAHAGLLALLWRGAPVVMTPPQVLAVEMISVPEAAPVPPAPTPEPVKPRVEPKVPPRPVKPTPLPLPEPKPVATPQPAPVVPAPPPVSTPAPEPAPTRPAVPSTGPTLRGGLVKPVYPFASRRDHEEGIVIVSIEVRADGTVGQVKVKKSSGFPRLDEAAVKQAKRWPVNPAREGDQAVTAWLDVRIPFELEE